MTKPGPHTFFKSGYFVALLVLLGVGGVVLTHLLLKQDFLQSQVEVQEARIEAHQQSLQATLKRYDYLPFVLSQNDKLFSLAFHEVDEANQLLAAIQQETLVDAVYILRPDGLTIASSNWDDPGSFINNNYGFRPYFTQAMEQGHGHFFGVGMTTGVPGYFVSARYPATGDAKAVIVVKINQSVFEAGWSQGEGVTFVSDRNGVLLLSSRSDWLYRTLRPLNDQQLSMINEQRQFGNNPLLPLTINLVADTPGLISINNESYVYAETQLEPVNWQVHHLTPYTNISKQLVIFWFQVFVVLLTLLAIFLFIRFLNVRNALRSSQGESLKLRELNQSLETEIIERKQVEASLRQAQADLRRTSKLAAMGQLSASITHELSQPLSAMKTYLMTLMPVEGQAAANVADTYQQKTVDKVSALVERMIRITQQLRYFARSGDKEVRRIDLRDAIEGALNITQPSIDKAEVCLEISCPDNPVWVIAGDIRMEQVLVNLLRNAVEAMQDISEGSEKALALSLSMAKDKAVIIVDDSGPGLSVEVQRMLFEPFYTTKPSGVGMGLGLAISSNIIAELSGTLRAENIDGGGARFIVELPLAELSDD